jgi:hypothetical protein
MGLEGIVSKRLSAPYRSRPFSRAAAAARRARCLSIQIGGQAGAAGGNTAADGIGVGGEKEAVM